MRDDAFSGRCASHSESGDSGLRASRQDARGEHRVGSMLCGMLNGRQIMMSVGASILAILTYDAGRSLDPGR